MHKLMYRLVATTKNKKKKRKKRNRPVFRHGMPPQGIAQGRTLLCPSPTHPSLALKLLYKKKIDDVIRIPSVGGRELMMFKFCGECTVTGFQALYCEQRIGDYMDS